MCWLLWNGKIKSVSLKKLTHCNWTINELLKLYPSTLPCTKSFLRQLEFIIYKVFWMPPSLMRQPPQRGVLNQWLYSELFLNETHFLWLFPHYLSCSHNLNLTNLHTLRRTSSETLDALRNGCRLKILPTEGSLYWKQDVHRIFIFVKKLNLNSHYSFKVMI